MQAPKRLLKMIRPFGPDNRDYGHEILRVKLKNGEEYAVDIAAAQHGYYDPVYPWEWYVQTRILKIKSVLSFGGSKAKYCGAEWCGKPGYKGAVRTALKEFAEIFDKAVGEWEGKGVKVADMLRMNEGAFVKTREELVKFVGCELEEYKGVFEKGATSKLGHGANDLQSFVIRDLGEDGELWSEERGSADTHDMYSSAGDSGKGNLRHD